MEAPCHLVGAMYRQLSLPLSFLCVFESDNSCRSALWHVTCARKIRKSQKPHGAVNVTNKSTPANQCSGNRTILPCRSCCRKPAECHHKNVQLLPSLTKKRRASQNFTDVPLTLSPFSGLRKFSQVVNRPKCEAYFSSGEIKKAWRYTSTSSYVHGVATF
jgi:hypothetical protein